MVRHRSSALISVPQRGYGLAQSEPSKQFRMVVRLAVACADAGVDYDIAWNLSAGRVTITCQGSSIPAAKPLPKEKRTKAISDWKPKQWEGEYRLEGYHNGKGLQPAMVIEHSSGLSLTMPCSTGEWGTEEGDANPNGKWSLTHTLTGRGFGLSLPIAKASEALLFAAACDADWHLPLESLRGSGERAYNETLIRFGNRYTREDGERRMKRLDARLARETEAIAA